MKILMVNKFLYPRGGAETYMFRVGGELARRGHRVEYFGMHDERNIVGNEQGLATFHMDFRGRSPARLLYPFQIIYSMEARRKLGQVADRFRPDVVHLNNINFQLTPSVIDAVKERGIPLVQTVHDYQMICPNHMLYNWKEGAVCERCVQGSRWNCARYSCIHGSRIKSVLGSVEAVVSWGRRSYEKVDRFLCPSRFLEEKLLSAADLFRGKTEMLRNFIELPAPEDFTPEEGEVPQGDYAVFAGRMDREKGVALLARAAELLPEVVFQVAGTGPMEHVLQGLPNVRLTGFLTGHPLKRLIAGAQVAVVPSVWYENCPLSILEAQALGTPVVTARLGGMEELVEDGVTGVLFRELTGEGLADALHRVLADREALERMSQNCVDRRKDMLTLEGYCAKLERIYEALASGRVGREGL